MAGSEHGQGGCGPAVGGGHGLESDLHGGAYVQSVRVGFAVHQVGEHAGTLVEFHQGNDVGGLKSRGVSMVHHIRHQPALP